MRRRKRALTLLEMMLVIALASLALGATAFQIPKLLKDKRFESAVAKVATRIKLAEELMLNYETDVLLTFTLKEHNSIKMKIKPLQSIPNHLKASLNAHSLIQGIDFASFKGKSYLYFDKTLGAHEWGTLEVGFQKKKTSLFLKGFPSQTLHREASHEPQEALYPEEILSFT